MEKNMKRVLLLALLSVSQVRSASAGQLQALAGAENHDRDTRCWRSFRTNCGFMKGTASRGPFQPPSGTP